MDAGGGEIIVLRTRQTDRQTDRELSIARFQFKQQKNDFFSPFSVRIIIISFSAGHRCAETMNPYRMLLHFALGQLESTISLSSCVVLAALSSPWRWD